MTGHLLSNPYNPRVLLFFRTHHDPRTPSDRTVRRQLAEKVVRLQSLMTPFYAQAPEVFRSPVSHYRMRAEFRLWHDGDDLYHIMFDSQTKNRIRVDSFPAASDLINTLMTAMIDGVRNNHVLRHKLFQIDYLTTLSDQAVVSMLYHKKLDDEWRKEAEALRDALRAQNLNVHLIGRATKTKLSWTRTTLTNACRLQVKRLSTARLRTASPSRTPP
ncbi:tRNA (uracil-5-)-methyltransferase [Citrobacter freundii]|nr:tRNA (uracil-5-)-methyltransferase [Citrobacter freundii]